jgi:putative transposase
MAGKYRRFDRVFKENAVKLSYEKRTIKEFAEELGILPCILTKWRQEYLKFGAGSFPGPGYYKVHPEKKRSFELEQKSKDLDLKFEILKKGSPYLFQGKLIIFQFIFDNEKIYPITKMCKVLEVGVLSYLQWKKKGISEKQKQVALLKEEISSIFFSSKKIYGGNKITIELHKRGYKIQKRQVYSYMKKLGLRRIRKRKFKITTDSKHNHYTAPNVLNRNFNVDAPSKVWVSDITYIETNKGFIYLTIIMDLYDRKIIGWSLSSGLSTEVTTLVALEMAVTNRKVSDGLIFHSDRGVQYANEAFTSKLNSFKCIGSMSRKGDHLDNSVSEAFFSSFKRELIHKNNLLTQRQLRIEIFEYIENWYNKTRLHSALNYKSIDEFNRLTSNESLLRN